MSERNLSGADAVLRERITELTVHIPCGGLRGPIRRRGRWQSCLDEDSPEKWQGHDVSRERDLCIVCLRGAAGGSSRWAWLACDDSRSINKACEQVWGFRPLALGRHSLMNGIGIRGGASPEVLMQQAERLVAFAKSQGGLREWRRQEYPRLAAKFDPLADIPPRVLAGGVAAQQTRVRKHFSCLEICAGAGGQSLGLERAGFVHELAVEIEHEPCETLRNNRPHWRLQEGDVREIEGKACQGIDLLAGGVPCPPFSIAGQQLGRDDERDLFPQALRLIREAHPKAVMLENVRGLSTATISRTGGQYRAVWLSLDTGRTGGC